MKKTIINLGIKVLLVTGLLSSTLLYVSEPNHSDPVVNSIDRAAHARVSEDYGRLPLSFEANLGQTDAQVKFVSRGRGYNLFLTATEAVLAWQRAEQYNELLRMQLSGANDTATLTGLDELPGKANYFIGSDRQQWLSDIPTFSRVKYENIYPGVDLVFYGNQRQLEYDFVIAPGADPATIKLAFHGAKSLEIDGNGDLLISTAGGEIRQHRPRVYQETNNKKDYIAGDFILESDREVSFQVASYDASRPLVIDPVLDYYTYLGGSGDDRGFDIAIDTTGNAYVTGFTNSLNFPTVGSLPASNGQNNGAGYDAFITKFNSNGSAVIYSTYLGGNGDDLGRGIAVDAAGNAYVTGRTDSLNFPVLNAYDNAFSAGDCVDFSGNPIPCFDAFVTKLNANGSAVLYSTYLGGSGLENGDAGDIAVDAVGNVYVIGNTESLDFPTTPNAYQSQPGGGSGGVGGNEGDAFIAKLDTKASGLVSLVYSTYLGSNNGDSGYGIAVDAAGNIYVTGFTKSRNASRPFPITAGACQPNFGGDTDIFVAMLDLSQAGSASLVYSTFLGGSGSDIGYAIAVDAAGNAYVTGAANNNGTFAAKINPSQFGASSCVYFKTDIGGNRGLDIGVDADGNAYVTGGNNGAFLSKLNSTGTAIDYFMPLAAQTGFGLAVDCAGNVYVTGETSSAGAATQGAYQTNFAGQQDAFIAKITENRAAVSDLSIIKSPPSSPAVIGVNITYSITVTNNGPCAATNVVVTDNLPPSTTFVSCASTGSGVCGGMGNNRTITIATLAAGTSATITIVANVNCSTPEGTLISNTITASSLTADPNHQNNSATATVTAVNTPPEITAPADVMLTTEPGASISSCSLLVSDSRLGQPTINDNCPDTVTLMRTGVPSNNQFPVGTTTITYTATDASGSTASATQKVIVIDGTRPQITAPQNVTVNTGAATSCSVNISNALLGNAQATDNCDSSPVITRSGVPSGNQFPVGTTILTYTATDAAGNTAMATQTVTVIDDTLPTITAPADIVKLSPTLPVTVTIGSAIANDNCADFVITNNAPAQFPTGETIVTWTVTDKSGNKASAAQRVRVIAAATMKVTAAVQTFTAANSTPTLTPLTVNMKLFDKTIVGSVSASQFDKQYNSTTGLISSAHISISGPQTVTMVNGTANQYIMLVPANDPANTGIGSGDYLLIGQGLVNGTTVYPGDETLTAVMTGSETELDLQVIVNKNGNVKEAKVKRQRGSLLIISEPAYIDVVPTQPFPIIYISVAGSWAATVTVAPPAGFVSTPSSQEVSVSTNVVQALDFTITQSALSVPSRINPRADDKERLKVTHKIKHNGKEISVTFDVPKKR